MYNFSVKILVAHSKDLFKMYFNSWFAMQQANNELVITSDEDSENVICSKSLPTIDDILSYINSFISFQQKSNKNILKYYFIIDAFSKLAKFFKNSAFKFAIDIKKLYSIFVKAIKKRISNQIFYTDNVESINDDDNASLKNIFANIGKNNVIMFNAVQAA
jgi:hypothetical protein